VGCERGLKRSSCSPACRRSPHPSERRRRKKGVIHPEDEALGYSRGGFSSKLHLSCDWKGRPLSIEVTAGQRNESTQLEALLESITLKLPEHLLADRSYSHESCRELLEEKGIIHTIPERRDQRERRERRGEDPPSFDADLYRKRNVVERCVGRLKQWRGVATRYEKRAVNYRAMVVVASLVIWLTA
jgi:transposase